MANSTASKEDEPEHGAAAEGAVPGAQTPADPMSQVRELLFGESERRTRDSYAGLSARLDGIHAEIGERLDAMAAQAERDRRELRDHHAAEMRSLGERIARMGQEIVEAAGKSERK
ncbi:hypothetical protein N9W17_01535 [Jannaschia sp.]|nr:hypothetical protein [Jannaschia sp.]